MFLTTMGSRASRGKKIAAEIIRFGMTGGVNSLLTIGLYQLLITFINPEFSYTVAWIAGFIFVAVAYPKYVFRSGFGSVRKIILLAISYLLSFSLGLFLTALFVEAGMHERLTVFAVIAITSSFNFIVAKLLFGISNNYSVSHAEDKG